MLAHAFVLLRPFAVGFVSGAARALPPHLVALHVASRHRSLLSSDRRPASSKRLSCTASLQVACRDSCRGGTVKDGREMATLAGNGFAHARRVRRSTLGARSLSRAIRMTTLRFEQ